MRSWTLSIAVLSLLLLTGCSTTMPRTVSWEYATVANHGDARTLREQLNRLGQEGWELVSVYSEADGWNQAVLKRAKKP